MTIGLCAATSRTSAEPRANGHSPRPVKETPRKGKLDSESDSRRYAELVRAADGDGDGQVSDGELVALVRAHIAKQVEARFARLDRDRDGRVTRAEVPQMLAARFERFDANGDASFTAAELEVVMQTQAVERCRAVFAELDVDGDGGLSVADASASRPTRISKSDAPVRGNDRRER